MTQTLNKECISNTGSINHAHSLGFGTEILSKAEFFSDLIHRFGLSQSEIDEIKLVSEIYPIRISKYYWNLVKERDDPIWKQCVPSIKELIDQEGEEDPLAEERDSPAPLITHRYPDRVLFLISSVCDMYCRFCTRKRKVGTEDLSITYEKIDKAIQYISEHEEITDVILSGGDALCAPIERLDYVLRKLRSINHIDIIRLGTRLPCSNPEKVTDEICEVIKQYHPIFVNVHFEHYSEITEKSIAACAKLVDAGIPVNNQNVLLAGVNDDAFTMGRLYKELLKMRVRPYYLFQADYVLGTNHFRTTVETGLEIIRNIRGFISGLAIPHYVIDAPNGGGKIPILPDYLQSVSAEKVVLKNYLGKECEYKQISNV